MIKYTPEDRRKAVALSKEIGVNKACNQLGMTVPTLRRWRREEKAREAVKPSGACSQIQDKEKSRMDDEVQKQEPISIHGIEESLRRDLADSRLLNQATQETIDYLIAENRELRRRCERYLKALAMIVE